MRTKFAAVIKNEYYFDAFFVISTQLDLYYRMLYYIKEVVPMPETENGEVYLTVEEATQYLGVSRDTLERYARAGQLTKYRRGVTRRVYYRQSELDRLKQFRPVDQDQDS